MSAWSNSTAFSSTAPRPVVEELGFLVEVGASRTRRPRRRTTRPRPERRSSRRDRAARRRRDSPGRCRSAREHPGQHRRGRRLAVRAGDHERLTRRQEELFRAPAGTSGAQPALARGGGLGVGRAHRVAAHDQIDRRRAARDRSPPARRRPAARAASSPAGRRSRPSPSPCDPRPATGPRARSCPRRRPRSGVPSRVERLPYRVVYERTHRLDALVVATRVHTVGQEDHVRPALADRATPTCP